MTDSDEYLQRARQLQQAYIAQLPATVEGLVLAWHSTRDSRQPAVLSDLKGRLHQLAGTGETFGFPAVTALSRSLEQALHRLLHQDDVGGADAATSIDRLFEELRVAAAQPPGPLLL